jgi:tetratricopeptide (TPR) repeat protein
MRLEVLTVAVIATAGVAHAGSREVHYGPPPSWIMTPPSPSVAPSPEGAPLRVEYSDTQVRIGVDGDEIYVANRVKVLQPQALALGNVTDTWNPSTDVLTINQLKIIRNGQAIDVLQTAKFRVIERENELEYSKLDGDLTANLQIPGLQVGDEIAFAATIRRRVSTFAGRSFNMTLLPPAGGPSASRIRFLWSDPKPLRWRFSPDLGQPEEARHGAEHELTYELRDPKSVVTADGAPARYNLRRLIEYSDFSSWGEVSNHLWPFFDSASKLAPGSPLRAEAARIAASTSDPATRAQAALALVQNGIRYVYVGLNGANYEPASADETWSRRFGDCKGKTVVLLALLRELGIKAEPVLVNSLGGEGIDQRLPTPGIFDHVLVRATIGFQTYWLDGTRLGDRRLDRLPPPTSRWGLPLRRDAVDLEAIPAQAADLPLFSSVVDLDATGGFGVPAGVKAEEVLRGDDARQALLQLSAMSADDTRRTLESALRMLDDWIEPEKVGWRYDEVRDALIITASGHAKLGWEGDDQNGRSLQIPSAGFTPPDEMRRPKEQDQIAPWLNDFPRFKRWTTIIRLPPATAKWRWSYSAAPVYEQLGGDVYWREASLKDGVMRTTMSRRAYLPEITAAQAQEVNDRLPKFDNNISQVFQVAAAAPLQADADATRPDDKAPPSIKAALAVRNQARAEALQAQAAAKGGRFDEALEHDTAALRLEPENESLFRDRADVLDRLGRRQEALSDLDEAWRINPLDPVTAAARAHEATLASTPSSSLALDPWAGGGAVAAVASPNERFEAFDTYLGEGSAALLKGLFKDAIAAYDKAVAAKPDNAKGYVMRGYAHGFNHELDLAFKDLNRAIELDPNNPDAYYARGLAYVTRKDCAHARGDFDKAIALKPDHAAAYLGRAPCQSQTDAAIADLTKAISINPAIPGAYSMRGEIYASRSLYQKAADDLTQAVAANPNDVQALKVLAEVQEQLGRKQDALASYKALAKLSAKDAADGLARLEAAH